MVVKHPVKTDQHAQFEGWLRMYDTLKMVTRVTETCPCSKTIVQLNVYAVLHLLVSTGKLIHFNARCGTQRCIKILFM
jgi:hypothetical protein